MNLCDNAVNQTAFHAVILFFLSHFIIQIGRFFGKFQRFNFRLLLFESCWTVPEQSTYNLQIRRLNRCHPRNHRQKSKSSSPQSSAELLPPFPASENAERNLLEVNRHHAIFCNRNALIYCPVCQGFRQADP